MAEGDTIHRLARRLEAALAEPIERVDAPAADSPLRLGASRLGTLVGARLERAEARGKHLLLHFDRGLALHSHLGMSGVWAVIEAGGRWPRPRRRARVVLASGDREAVQFGGTTLALVTEPELRRDRRLGSLGPDILAGELDLTAAVASLRRAGADRGLGEALLDQRLIAGIGNIFKSEGCFEARADPWRPLGEVGDEELGEVVAATRNLMLAAVRSGRQPKRVYRRRGRPCPRCGAPIHSRGQGDANRRTYWCEGCQR